MLWHHRGRPGQVTGRSGRRDRHPPGSTNSEKRDRAVGNAEAAPHSTLRDRSSRIAARVAATAISQRECVDRSPRVTHCSSNHPAEGFFDLFNNQVHDARIITTRLAFAATLACLAPRGAHAQQVPAARPAASDSAGRDSAGRDSIEKALRARPATLSAVTITSTPAARSEPSSGTHVSASTIELTPASTPWELLRQTAGMEVHQAGQGPGFASDASVRGFSSDHSTDLALWIDGVPVNEPVNGHAEGYNDWSLIFPQIVQDIDVIKGPTSALFGNFALSGVVNVRTLERASATEASVSGGSFGHAEGSLITGFDHGSDGGGVFALRLQHENGFRPNSANDVVQGHARVVRDVTSNATIDAGAELYGARWDSPGYLSEQEFADRRYDIVSNGTDGGYKRRAQERVSLRVIQGDNVLWRTTAYATQGLWRLFLTIPPQGGKFEGSGSQTEEDDTRYGFGLTSALTYTRPGLDATVGTEGRFDRANYRNYFTTSRSRDSTDALYNGRQISGALFAQAAADVSSLLRVNLGARYDVIDTRSTPIGDASASAAYGIFSPKFGALVHVTREIGVYANASRGFRSSDGIITDPSLSPITLWAYETGVKVDIAGTTASAALFRMNVSNEQTFNPLTAGVFNGGSSRRQGLELGLRTPTREPTAITADWTFNDARYTKQIAPPEDSGATSLNLAGLRVYNTARYVGSAALDIAPRGTVANAPVVLQISGNAVGPYSPFDEPGVILPAYGLIHASAKATLGRSAVLDVGVRNVLDRSYPEVVAGHLVAPGEPRSIDVGLRYRLP